MSTGIFVQESFSSRHQGVNSILLAPCLIQVCCLVLAPLSGSASDWDTDTQRTTGASEKNTKCKRQHLVMSLSTSFVLPPLNLSLPDEFLNVAFVCDRGRYQ